MKRIKIGYTRLNSRNIRKYFAFFRDISRMNRDIILNFSQNEEPLPNSYKMLLKACAEKNNIRTRFKIYAQGLSNQDNQFEAVHLQRDKQQLILESWDTDASSLSKIKPKVTSNFMQKLKRIGINRNNKQYSEKYERVEALLGEIIANATEHGIKNQNINYWITCDVDNKEKAVHFSFVDLGIGIAGSHRQAGLSFWERLQSDRNIVMKSFYGKMPSSTKDPNRGKGLPEILNIVKSGFVDNFYVISNKVAIYYDSINGLKTYNIASFEGTYYQWTVKKQNNNDKN